MKVQVWAHRGASSDAPENTLEAFELAAQQHADGIELDVQMSADGELVVAHDETLDRVSNGSGFIKDKSLAELKLLDFSKPCPRYSPARIPMLREVYQLIRPTGMLINVEIKSGIILYPGIEQKLVRLEREMEMKGRVLYSSFNHYSLLELRKADPQTKIALLYADGWVGVPAYAKSMKANAVHPSKYNLRAPGLVGQCKRMGIGVHPWTLDTEQDILEAASLGVDAIITNRPAFAVEVLRRPDQ